MSIHFAVVTLVITALLAMFADDERVPSPGPAVAHAETIPSEDAISRAAHGESANSIVNRTDETQGTFGPEESPSTGTGSGGSGGFAQVAGAGYEAGSTLPPGLSPYALPTSLPPGLTLEQWLALKENAGDTHKGDLPQVNLTAADIRALSTSGNSQPPAPNSY